MVIRIKLFRNLASAALVVVASLLSAMAMEPETIGFVYVTPIGDAGWTYQHNQGRLQMEKASVPDG